MWSLFTMLTPFAAHTDLWALLIVRFLTGIGEGAAFSLSLCSFLAVPGEKHKVLPLSHTAQQPRVYHTVRKDQSAFLQTLLFSM